MNNQRTILLVLRSGGDFAFRDVELIARHINMKWQSRTRPRIVCLWDKASQPYNLGNIEIVPLTNDHPGTWSRIALYAPEMEQYRPFLYVDLDTAIIESLEKIFELVRDTSMFIPLEDFYQQGQLATGLVWFPANSNKIKAVWKAFQREKPGGTRMDYFLRKVIQPDAFWQQFPNNGIVDFKPKTGSVLMQMPKGANVICFHGKPRIFQAGDSSMSIPWVSDYIHQQTAQEKPVKATVIISYKKDRGWLQDAIKSVPGDVQLILSPVGNTWSAGFNAALPQAKGRYIKYLHDDDKITPNGIDDSIQAIEMQGVDFIHGDVVDYDEKTKRQFICTPLNKTPNLWAMLKKNYMHSASMMYRREVFEKLGGMDESLITSEDYEFNLRCLYNGLKVGYCPTPVAVYRRHKQQKVRNIPLKIQGEKRALIRKRYTPEYVRA